MIALFALVILVGYALGLLVVGPALTGAIDRMLEGPARTPEPIGPSFDALVKDRYSDEANLKLAEALQ